MAYPITYIYQIIDKFSPALKAINKATTKFKDGMINSRAALKNFGDKTANVKNALVGLGAGAALAVTAGKAMEFEDVMTDVRKVITFNSDEAFEDFREQIFKTSVELGKMPKDIAQIAVAGGKLGVLPEDLNDFIGVVARTSVAFDMLEGEAGDQIGSIKAKLGMTVTETGNLMDAINYLADNTAASGRKMIEVIARTSGNLATIKMPTKFMAGWAAFADQLEVSPELAASGINMMMARMRKVPGMLEKMMKSPHEAIGGFLTEITKMDDIKRSKFIDEVFGPEAGRFILKATANMELFHKTMNLVKDEGSFTGSMMKELEKKLKTANTAWGQMKSSLEIISITIGDLLLPYIKEMAPRVVKATLAFREWAKTHPGLIKLALALTAIMAIMVPMLIIAGVIAGAIAALTWPITLVVGGFALLSAAVLGVIVYWDELVEKVKKGVDFLKLKLQEFREGFKVVSQGFKGAGKEVLGWFETLDKKLGLNNETTINNQAAGIAAQNTIASQSTLNGNITVEATQGTAVKSTNMQTDVPGNLGFNMAGVGM